MTAAPALLVCTKVTAGVQCGRRLWAADVVYRDPGSPTGWNTRPPDRAEQLWAANLAGWRVEVDAVTCWDCRHNTTTEEGTTP